MVERTATSLIYALLVLPFLNCSVAFQICPLVGKRCPQHTTIRAAQFENDPNDGPSARRDFLGSIAMGLLTTTVIPSDAHASYSAYTHREEDWQQRQKTGDVQYSSASGLRAQLREIAPANSSGRQLFCPNGATANVSPLMENRCGDKMAIPSVYGRTEDALGNSIPGFSGGFYDSGMQFSNAAADTGALPNYGSFTSNIGGAQRAR